MLLGAWIPGGNVGNEATQSAMADETHELINKRAITSPVCIFLVIQVGVAMLATRWRREQRQTRTHGRTSPPVFPYVFVSQEKESTTLTESTPSWPA